MPPHTEEAPPAVQAPIEEATPAVPPPVEEAKPTNSSSGSGSSYSGSEEAPQQGHHWKSVRQEKGSTIFEVFSFSNNIIFLTLSFKLESLKYET